MTTVYLLTADSGCDDYRVLGVFSSPEKWKIGADKYAGYDVGSFNEVEEYELDELADSKTVYEVWMDKDGQDASTNLELPGYLKGHKRDDVCILYKEQLVRFRTLVEADEKERAIKVANERRAYLIASGEWDRLEAEARKKRRK